MSHRRRMGSHGTWSLCVAIVALSGATAVGATRVGAATEDSPRFLRAVNITCGGASFGTVLTKEPGCSSTFVDSPALSAANGNPWVVVETWRTMVFDSRLFLAFKDVRLWLGVPNGGGVKRFDILVEASASGGVTVASTLRRCIKLTESPTAVSFPDPFLPEPVDISAAGLFVIVSTRAGTNNDDTPCGLSPAGARLRVFFNSAARDSKLVTVRPVDEPLLSTASAARSRVASTPASSLTLDYDLKSTVASIATRPLCEFVGSMVPVGANTAFCPSSLSVDSGPLNGKRGNPWLLVGQWDLFLGAESPFAQEIVDLKALHAWLGLKNSDDVGSRFDLQAIVTFKRTGLQPTTFGQVVGMKRCISGLGRNPTGAKEVLVDFDPFVPFYVGGGALSPEDLVIATLAVSARMGTNPDDTLCGGHSSAAGLRMYFGSLAQDSRFEIIYEAEDVPD